jgi:electron transfer flavoprotein alpha subunit
VLTGPVEEQAAAAVAALADSGAWTSRPQPKDITAELPEPRGANGAAVAVLVEPERPRVAAELLGAAADVATRLAGHVVAVAFDGTDTARLAAQGADRLIVIKGASVEEDAAAGVAAWASEAAPAVIVAPGTIWGREVASRVAARLGAGLTGDAVDLSVEDGRLVGWKPAFGGCLVAAITASSPIQMATLRPGMATPPAERRSFALDAEVRTVEPRGRIRHLDAWRDDDVGVLTAAEAVVGVGAGVHPDEYPLLDPLLATLGAELGGTRKVTDKGWLPRARQIGITGHSIGPRLYVAIGISGKFNHMVGVRGAGFIVAVNADPDAAIRDGADLTLTGDWHDLVPALVDELERVRGLAASA